MRKIRALEVIGICLLSILLFKMTVRNASWIRTILTRQPDLQRRYQGGYAVITGASSGIGKYIAYELAQRKFNLILIGSTRNKDTKAWLDPLFPTIDIVVLENVDFSQSFQPKFFERIFRTLDRYDISILVNNVASRSGWTKFEDMPAHIVQQTIAVGTLPQVRFMQYAIKRFETRSKSAIMTITAQCVHNTDLFAIQPTLTLPFLSVYEASNAFGYFQANSVYHELQKRNLNSKIDFLNITPGAVITEKTKDMLSNVFSMSVPADQFAKKCVQLLGVVQGTQNAYWKHQVSGLVANAMPFAKQQILQTVGYDIASAYQKKAEGTV